ncbi:hypothetical protein CSPAE12_03910 [Colletotrichum incanum]|nr:hypothetical protein CSPAE12_03910 [Colletotrichum incanum]
MLPPPSSQAAKSSNASNIAPPARPNIECQHQFPTTPRPSSRLLRLPAELRLIRPSPESHPGPPPQYFPDPARSPVSSHLRSSATHVRPCSPSRRIQSINRFLSRMNDKRLTTLYELCFARASCTQTDA